MVVDVRAIEMGDERQRGAKRGRNGSKKLLAKIIDTRVLKTRSKCRDKRKTKEWDFMEKSGKIVDRKLSPPTTR